MFMVWCKIRIAGKIKITKTIACPMLRKADLTNFAISKETLMTAINTAVIEIH
jgi:hypothetical protein